MRIKIFTDGADIDSMIEMYHNPVISGLTTNPTLMAKAGVKNYKSFALEVLKVIKDKPISFEVFSDDFTEMKRQALEIASWGPNVYVKIPITNTKGESSEMLIEDLNWSGIKINVTAITTIEQVNLVFNRLKYKRGTYISVFAGRIADTGLDPKATIERAVELSRNTDVEVIWASPREVYNIYQADNIGCHIITCTPDMIRKFQSLSGRDLKEYSLDTVRMFYNDSLQAGYQL